MLGGIQFQKDPVMNICQLFVVDNVCKIYFLGTMNWVLFI